MPSADRRARIKELLQSFGLWERRKDVRGHLEPRDEAEAGRRPGDASAARTGFS